MNYIQILLASLALLFFSARAMAQTDSTGVDSLRTPEGRAAAFTAKMKTQLSLTDEQYPQVQALNLEYAQKNEAIMKGDGGRMAKFQDLKSSRKKKDKAMKKILTTDQYAQYERMEEDMKNKMMAQYRSQKGG
ncbi:MAG TPA: hypothetical protein VL547_00520 [Dinghuibacter sp.]|uniref:hypothetical protein n=1 Tax=Dinghuibacter sp. TaxID=2024697 RepID=UPI002B6DCD33|nr:hypothetical protein [Dinghuibacter sp.]HTJ10471.1 hypothetical protein [Dinghuibacter sp.]